VPRKPGEDSRGSRTAPSTAATSWRESTTGRIKGIGDAHLAEHRPAGEAMAIDEEGAQGKLGRLHGRAGVVLLLAQEQKAAAELILGERERIAAEVRCEFAHAADVFLPGGRAMVLELDKLLELCDGGMGMVGIIRRTTACLRKTIPMSS
jgi:hypothetical protein